MHSGISRFYQVQAFCRGKAVERHLDEIELEERFEPIIVSVRAQFLRI